MKPEKRFTTILLSSSQSRMLRTGQMRLPVRVAKPIELQYKIPVVEVIPGFPQEPVVEAIPELPQEPKVGEFYMYKGLKVECIALGGCSCCVEPCRDHHVLCGFHVRSDNNSVQLVPVD